jgi:hypothetical protein
MWRLPNTRFILKFKTHVLISQAFFPFFLEKSSTFLAVTLKTPLSYSHGPSERPRGSSMFEDLAKSDVASRRNIAAISTGYAASPCKDDVGRCAKDARPKLSAPLKLDGSLAAVQVQF